MIYNNNKKNDSLVKKLEQDNYFLKKLILNEILIKYFNFFD